MRIHGNLGKWNDERGFGFLIPAQGGEEVFVHISAFPSDGTRPRIGELLSFEVEGGDQGKRRAVRVQRPGGVRVRPNPPRREARSGVVQALVLAAFLVSLAVMAYRHVTRDPAPSHAALSQPLARAPAQTAPTAEFNCDGRTHCAQMTSCAEAEFFLRHCPDVKLDGNHDGEPCEQQWCTQ